MRRQSEHFAEYKAVLDRLIARGAGLSRLHEPRRDPRLSSRKPRRRGSTGRAIPTACRSIPALDKELSRARAPAAHRRRRAVRLAARRGRRARARVGEPLSWTEFAARIFGDAANRSRRGPQEWGDVVLARRDVPTSYHLSVVVDDAAARRHPCRARPRPFRRRPAIQRLLQELLGLPAPAYFHHQLVDGPDGRKLSKSENDTGLAARCAKAARRRPTSGGWSGS